MKVDVASVDAKGFQFSGGGFVLILLLMLCRIRPLCAGYLCKKASLLRLVALQRSDL